MGEQCNLTHSGAAIMVQIVLGLVLIVTMLVKWCCEEPRRVFRVWIFDAMKQVFAAAIQHVCNVVIASVIFSMAGGIDHDETCGWYMITMTVDASLGTFIAWLLLRHAVEPLAIKYDWESMKVSGDYGQHGGNINCSWWGVQLLVWLLVTVIGRCVCLGTLAGCRPLFAKFVTWLTNCFGEEHTFAYLVVSMLVWPMIVNVCQVIIQDNILMDTVRKRETLLEGGGDGTAAVNYVSINDDEKVDAGAGAITPRGDEEGAAAAAP